MRYVIIIRHQICDTTNNREERKLFMNITIVGAGNVGTQLAVHAAEKGHSVVLYSSKPEKIDRRLSVVDENGKVIHCGVIEKATKDEYEAFFDAELIFVTTPATMMKETANKISPFVKSGLRICLVPGSGGGECAFRSCIQEGGVVFGIQRVPSVARLVEYGKSVRAIGYRNEMYAAAIPQNRTTECCGIIESILDIRCSPLPNYLNITLTPSNPILHTTRLKCLFEDYKAGVCYEEVPLFYQDWNNQSSELLLACDDEVQRICRALMQFDFSGVKPLAIHYESPTAEALTKKISNIAGFRGLTSPVMKAEGGYIPDFGSRYFTADFPYGLAILIQIAEFAEVDVPNMRETLDWYYGLVGRCRGYQFTDYGICSYEDFIEFYSQ